MLAGLTLRLRAGVRYRRYAAKSPAINTTAANPSASATVRCFDIQFVERWVRVNATGASLTSSSIWAAITTWVLILCCVVVSWVSSDKRRTSATKR
jgi:hypothetical protein